MNTLDNYPILIKYNWSIEHFVNDCQGITIAEYENFRYNLSSTIDDYLSSTHKCDEEYLNFNKDKIIVFKSFLRNSILYVKYGTEEVIGAKITEYEIQELKRLREGLKLMR